ncbi:MAG: hypothetical protein IJP43_04095 [Oscillospiraceae bacterium]|nr:hypothetical protein [Oscillospiraceae bacterium]MBQ6756113.1 hypothetical protein [Oscillospiraceae bacterium]
MSACFFIGHRDAPETLRPLLDEAVERHITEYGVTDFVVGHYGRFDAMAAHAIREAKQRHPEVTLTLLIPYYPFQGLKELSQDYDATFYPPEMETVPKPYATVRANEYMIRTSDYLICYDRGQIGKTRDFVELARQRERKGLIHIENLAEEA